MMNLINLRMVTSVILLMVNVMKMTGLYVHIPYCQKACHYCDFHFSTNHKTMNKMIQSLCHEIELKSPRWSGMTFDTIYFGGGTPSILAPNHFDTIIQKIRDNVSLNSDVEFTVEANPEDINDHKLDGYKKHGVNRLSVGIQTFDNESLNFINRNHSAETAIRSVELIHKAGIDNINVDLIFGIPNSSGEKWQKDLEQLIELGVHHASIYGLTIEEKTVFGSWFRKGKISESSEDLQTMYWELAEEILGKNGFEHYEVSNYAISGYRSRHNSSYWQQKPYFGIGPGAHSYDGKSRSMNITNNIKYINALEAGAIPESTEQLSAIQHINEYILTHSRTDMGIDPDHIQQTYGFDFLKNKGPIIQGFVKEGIVREEGGIYFPTKKGFLVADEIALKLAYDEQ